MAVENPSFETPSDVVGEPLGWLIADNSAHVEVAEFGDLLGYEGFERDWRLPLGLNIEEGVLTGQKLWASIINDTPTIDPAPSSDTVLNPVIAVLSGTVPGVAGGAGVTVTLTYTNEDGVVSRVGTVVIPAGADGGIDYVISLEGDDIGFTEITDLETTPALPAVTLGVVGSWFLEPRNEGAKFAFSEDPGVDLFPFSIDFNPFEGFEGGWGNVGGFRNNFDLLLSDAAEFSGLDFSNFEQDWKLPRTPYASPFNEVRRVAIHNFIDGITLGSSDTLEIITDVNDTLSLEFEDNGTLLPVNATLAAGEYGAAALASEIQTKVRAALNADGGDAIGTDFSCVALASGTLRISTTFTIVGSERGYMVLLEPSQHSAWADLGFTTGAFSARTADSETNEASSLNPEDFEDDWRSNQDSVFSLPATEEYDFGGTGNSEEFETGWTLTL